MRDKVFVLEGKEEKVNYFCELKGESGGGGGGYEGSGVYF